MTPSGHELTVRAWESRNGREGLWCDGCRSRTPVAQLTIVGRDAYLHCEGCARLLAVGESCLAAVGRLLPRPRVASAPAVSS